MLIRDTVDLLSSAREARGYALRCRRILKKGILTRGIEKFIRLGKDFFNYPRGVKDLQTEIMGTFMGSCLAVTTEDRWLSSNKGPHEEYGRLLREKGVKTLSDLGRILQNARSPEFIDYVPALVTYFEGYHTWAHEMIALEDKKDTPNYNFPLTPFGIAIGAGDCIS